MAYQADLSKLEAILNSAVAAIITIDTDGIDRKRQPGDRAHVRIRDRRTHRPECPHADAGAVPRRARHLSRELSDAPERRRSSASAARSWASARTEPFFPIDLAVSEFVSEGKRYFSGIISDLSDRKRVEEALLESERQARASPATRGGGSTHRRHRARLQQPPHRHHRKSRTDRDAHRARANSRPCCARPRKRPISAPSSPSGCLPSRAAAISSLISSRSTN